MSTERGLAINAIVTGFLSLVPILRLPLASLSGFTAWGSSSRGFFWRRRFEPGCSCDPGCWSGHPSPCGPSPTPPPKAPRDAATLHPLLRCSDQLITSFRSTGGSTHLSPRLALPQSAQESSKIPTKRGSCFPRVPHAGAVMAASPPKLPPSLQRLLSGPSPWPSTLGARGRLRQSPRKK